LLIAKNCQPQRFSNFLSALDEVLDKVKAFSVGGVDYISKPFQFEEVCSHRESTDNPEAEGTNFKEIRKSQLLAESPSRFVVLGAGANSSNYRHGGAKKSFRRIGL